jgi:proline racemase
MHFTAAAEALGARFATRIKTIDSHTAGETTSLVIGMQADIPGDTIRAKRNFFIENCDAIRKLLTYEPRGLGEVFVAVVTEPVTRDAEFGLIYMDAHRYPYLCGHATIGAVTTMIEAGLLVAGEGALTVVVDTPSGPLAARAKVEKGRVLSVAINMVPSFVQATDCRLHLPDQGNITVSLVCVGGFFAMVPVEQLGMQMIPENRRRFIQLGMEIIAAANEQLEVKHPKRPEVKTVDVTEFYNTDTSAADRHTGIVIYGESHMDRSPCGTGTAAKMTLLHHFGKLQINEPYLNTGPLGTVFQGRLIEETRVGNAPAVVAEIEGRAHITGWHEFVLSSEDPFPEGFRL